MITSERFPITELRRMLPQGTSYYASSHGFMVTDKKAIFGRSVIMNTNRRMASLITSGPKKGMTIWLTWKGVSAEKNIDGSVSLTSLDGVKFMTIHFSEPSVQESTPSNQESM